MQVFCGVLLWQMSRRGTRNIVYQNLNSFSHDNKDIWKKIMYTLVLQAIFGFLFVTMFFVKR